MYEIIMKGAFTMLELNNKFTPCGVITPDCNSFYTLYAKDDDGTIVYDDTDSGVVICVGDLCDKNVADISNLSTFYPIISSELPKTGFIGLYIRKDASFVGFWKKGDSIFTGVCQKPDFTAMPQVVDEITLDAELTDL